MPDRIKPELSEANVFHLDEHVDPDIARALRRHGIDVTTTVETGHKDGENHASLS